MAPKRKDLQRESAQLFARFLPLQRAGLPCRCHMSPGVVLQIAFLRQ
jgi:hypothetical protein